jgi:phosphoglycerol transferase
VTENSNRNTGLKSNFLIFAAIVVFIAILLRNCGIYPVVFRDEYIYSKLSRLLPFDDSTIPGYLYLAIYRLTNICGDGFLNCARILNTLFFVATMPFIYLTTRRVSTRLIASIVALLAILGPINTYTAYYMPEALYYFSFWLLTWFILQLDNTFDLKSWCFAGILLGFSTLIKPHALFLLPALVVFILYVNRKKEGKWVLQGLRNGIIFVASSFVVKFSIGYLLAGKAGLSMFGPDYTSMASETTSHLDHYSRLISLSTESAKGHILAICLMFGVPIAFAIKASVDSVLSKEEVRSGHRIAVYTLLVLVNLILVTSLFTGSVAGVWTYETAARLHMRYYNFALPLLLVIAASQLSLEQTTNMLKRRAIAAFPIGAAILCAVYTFLASYTPNLVDSPELRGFTYNLTVFNVLSGISFLALAFWVYSARAGAKIFVYLLMPLAVGFSTYYVNQELRQRLVPDVFDKAGIITKQFLPNEELSRLVIVGSEPELAGLYRSLFYLDNPTASLETIPQGAAYDLSKLAVSKEWILVIGDHSLPENMCYQLRMDGFTLARATRANTVDFKKSAWPGVISRTRGLSAAEPWGTWSSGNVVSLEFIIPLPEKFTVHLVAGAFGPNVGKEFVAHVGDSAVRFTLAGGPEERVLEFSNPKGSKIITIDVPSPCSPKKLGMSDDTRSLGIALWELWIRTALKETHQP